jgi:hypothetical protein
VTREQQIHAALRLLAPEPARRSACQSDIEEALKRIARDTSRMVVGSKAHKEALMRFVADAKRLEAARKGLLGPQREWTEQGIKEVPSLAPVLSAWIVFGERQLARLRPRGPARGVASPKYHAVRQARRLLGKWGRGRLSKTRGGPWHRLAAVLHGDARADLFYHLQTYRDVNLF